MPPRRQRINIPLEDREWIVDRLIEILDNGQLAYGKYVAEFEKKAAEMAGTTYAAAVGSGTQALEIAVRALRLKGKRVAICANGYVATAQAILHAGAFVAFVDCGKDLMLDPAKLPKAPGAVDAVMVTHIGGHVSQNLGAIIDYCKERDIPLLEDAAHAHGSTSECGRAGSIGAAAGFSFHATKLATTAGEGGVIATNDAKVDLYARQFRHQGRAEPGHERVPDVVMHGHNFCMTEIQAVVGITQLNRLPLSIRNRRKALGVYRDYFRMLETPGANGYKAVVLEPLKAPFPLPSKVYDRPIPLEPAWGQREGSFPVAEQMCANHVTIPLYNDITPEQARYIAEALLEARRPIGEAGAAVSGA